MMTEPNAPTLEELREELADVEREIAAFDPDDHLDEDTYADMLDECWGPVKLCGMEYAASQVLREVDPTAYRVGFNEYAASMEPEDFEAYCELVDQRDELAERIEEMEADEDAD
jgi:hypothetical protein